MPINQNVLGVLNGATNIIATAGTAVLALLPPWQGAGYQKLVQTVKVPQAGGLARIEGGEGILHVTKLAVNNLTTLQDLIVLRPKNWSYLTADAAKNQAVIVLKDDPGVYATNYRYNGGTAPALADNGIAANDYAVFQLADGSWWLDLVSSVSVAGSNGAATITMTTNLPNLANGKVVAGSPFYFFGIQTDTDPAEGSHLSYGVSSWKPGWQARASVNTANDLTILDTMGYGLFSAYNAGDPLLVYCANATTAITGFYATGFYSRH